MSDEPSGLTNVEDDTQPATPPAEPPAQPQAEEPAAAEVEAVEVGGKKYVPLAAVIAERKEKQALRERASKADEYERTIADMRPFVDFVRANPELTRARQPQPVAPPAPEADPAVEQLARTLDLYTPEGKPDLTRAGAVRQMMRESARQAAAEAVGPVRAQSNQERSAANLQRALTMKMPDDSQVDPGALQTLWRALPDDLTANPDVASMITLMAAGAERIKPKAARVAPPANPPIQTEAAGGNQPTRRALSSIERAVIRERGITEEKYHKLSDGFTPGRTNVLEND